MIDVDEYHRMADLGLIAPDSRVELLDGEVVDMAPIGTRHNACVMWLTRAFSRSIGDRALLGVQGSMRLGRFSEPQPDIALFRPRDDLYASRYAEPEDVLLLIEVADSSARKDRTRKVPLYLKSGVPEVWLIDLKGGTIEVFIGDTVRTLRAGDQVPPQAFPDIVLEVAEFLV